MLSRFFLVSFCLLFLLATAFAAVPTVDFSWYPTIVNAFSDVNFDPSITTDVNLSLLAWQFGSDGNKNYFSIPTDDKNVIFSDNFNDGDISDWTQVSGTWTAASNYLSVSTDPAVIRHDVNQPSDTNKHIDFTFYVTGANDVARFVWYSTADTIGTNGYGLSFTNNAGGGNEVLLRLEGGATLFQNSQAVSTGAYHDVNVYHDANGWIQVIMDGIVVGTASDTTYQDGNRIFFHHENAATEIRFDDLNYTEERAIIDFDKNETIHFSSAGNQNVCLTAQNNSGATTTCHLLDVNGAFRLTFFDENTGKQFAPTTITVNNVAQSLDGNSLVYSLAGVTTLTDYTIRASDANKTEREWLLVDKNQDSAIDINAFLLDTNLGRSIEFQLLNPTKTALLANAIVSFLRGNDYNYASIKQLDSSGKAIFFVNQDANYSLNIDADANGDSDYNYSRIILTVLVPKNEDTLVDITPFRVEVSGLASYDINNLSASTTIPLFGNTVDYYLVNVSEANPENYFSREYLQRHYGNPATAELQSYLVSDAELSSTINVTSTPEGNPLSGIVVKAYRLISTDTLVESKQTDGAGNALFSFVIGKNYTIEFRQSDYDETLIFSTTINATATVYYASLFLGDLNFGLPTGFYLDSNYLQKQVTYNEETKTFDLNALVFTNQNVITKIVWNVYNDGNLLYTETRTTNLGLMNDFNRTIVLLDQNQATFIHSEFVVTIILDGATYVRTTDDIFNFSNPHVEGMIVTAGKLKTELGAIIVAVLAIIIALMAHGLAANNFQSVNYTGLVVLFGAMLWGFVAFGWLDAIAVGIASFIGASAWARERG